MRTLNVIVCVCLASERLFAQVPAVPNSLEDLNLPKFLAQRIPTI